MRDIVGMEVYNKRKGLLGKIIKETPDVVVIDYGNAQQTITHGSLQRWFRLLTPSDLETLAAPKAIKSSPKKNNGPVMEGGELLSYLRSLIRQRTLEFDVEHYRNMKSYVIRYQGKKILEGYIGKKHLIVMAHRKALTPTTLGMADQIFPESYGSMGVKFIIHNEADYPRLQSVVTDSLYYRKEN